MRRSEPPRLPEVSEPELVRHYVNLSKRNFDLDSGFYPLGSCTMKHNPRLHERVAALPGHARLHPLQAPARAQGALELMWNLERSLSEIAGLPHVSLQPSAGSHGELAGVLLTKAFHEDRGEHRHKVLTPDTAHGTNPATVTMGGYEVVKVGTNADGGVDLDDLRAKATTDVACLMLTNPNTLGVFDPNIEEIARIVHEAGATLYYDGANLNAIMGICRPGDMGFDIVHFNLHKSFTQPHGGGGPGSGPIAVSDRIEPYLTKPVIRRDEDGSFDLDEDRPKSIGRLRGFQGNYGCFVRSYAYIRSLGAEGLKDASETAVLNANYLLARLNALGCAEHLPLRLREALHARVRPVGRADEARPADQDARPRQAPARPRLPPADGLLPAAGRRGAAGRADGDGDQGDARRVRRRRSRRSCARPARTRRSPRTRRTPRRSDASTRRAPRSARSSGSRSSDRRRPQSVSLPSPRGNGLERVVMSRAVKMTLLAGLSALALAPAAQAAAARYEPNTVIVKYRGGVSAADRSLVGRTLGLVERVARVRGTGRAAHARHGRPGLGGRSAAALAPRQVRGAQLHRPRHGLPERHPLLRALRPAQHRPGGRRAGRRHRRARGLGRGRPRHVPAVGRREDRDHRQRRARPATRT